MAPRIMRFLASVRLAAVLMGILLAACVISFVVPQSNKPQLTLYETWSANNPELAAVINAVGFDDVFSSPLMMAIYALLAANLTACTLRRLSRRRRRRVSVPPAPEHATDVGFGDAAHADRALRSALSRVSRAWKPTRSEGGDGVVLDGGWLGFIGSMILHAGLILLLVGGLVSALTRFGGELALTVGQSLPDVAESYPAPPREPLFGSGYSDGSVGLESLQFDYEDGLITSAEGVLSFQSAEGFELKKVRINEPARWNGKSYLLFSGGHAVALRVADKNGSVLLDGIVRLGDRTDGGYADTAKLADGSVLGVRTAADASDPRKSDEEVMIIRDPQVTVTVTRGSQPATSATLTPGARAEVDGLTVEAGRVTLWTTFLVREDGGIPVTYLAFALVIIGMTLRLAFPNRSVVAWAHGTEDGGATVRVWSRRNLPAEETVAERLVAHLQEEVRT